MDFAYKKLTLSWILKKTIWFNFLYLFLIFGGVMSDAPSSWVVSVVIVCIMFNSNAIHRVSKENKFPIFTLNEEVIEIHSKYENLRKAYQWIDLVKCRLVSPYENPRIGFLKFLEGRPGFELQFRDGYKVRVYQRIEHYYEFYQMLADKMVDGVEHELPFYDRLNWFGQSIDGKMNIFNNYGEPKYTKQIKLVKFKDD